MTELSTNCGLNKICAVAQKSSLKKTLAMDSGSQKKKKNYRICFPVNFVKYFKSATPKNRCERLSLCLWCPKVATWVICRYLRFQTQYLQNSETKIFLKHQTLIWRIQAIQKKIKLFKKYIFRVKNIYEVWSKTAVHSSEKCRKIHGKRAVPESLFNKITSP